MSISCSEAAASANEVLQATAPVARCWIVIEQPGPWGRQALTDSHFNAELGALIATKSDTTGVSVLLARHPTRLERDWDSKDRRAWIAVAAPGGMRLRAGVMPDPSVVGEWDFSAMASGHLPAFGSRTQEPLFLICTHSGRDACCAVHGRSLIDSMPASERIWECSHLGGHRFAPTAISLPDGYVYGRLDVTSATSIVSASTFQRMQPSGARGRTCFPPPLQAADLAVRAHIAEEAMDALDVLRVVSDRVVPVAPKARIADEDVECEVRHRDGRAWRVLVAHERTSAVRIESCMGDPKPLESWSIQSVTETQRWSTPE